jgi:hypothetical protein
MLHHGAGAVCVCGGGGGDVCRVSELVGTCFVLHVQLQSVVCDKRLCATVVNWHDLHV